ncbi:hypothetical protein KAR91_13905 [Candidatus Pacearchaeota archaeon]|nr:hypothetical protein [Candidatus Pacearchaeota archaeon]
MQKLLELYEVENGWVLKLVWPGMVEVDDSYSVFIDDETNDALTPVLKAVASRCGDMYDKFGDDNLNITWDKKGHKVD